MEKFNEKLLNEIKEYFLENIKEEQCGLIVQKENNDFHFHKTKNLADNKTNNFSIDPKDYLFAASYGKIIWCCHSHIKDCSFSVKDIENSFNHKVNNLLYNIKKDKFYFFEFEKFSKYKKYLGKDFFIGKNDCSTLLMSFYADEFNHKCRLQPFHIGKNISYEEIKKENKHIWSIENYQENTENFIIFKPESFDELKEYDLIIFKDNNNSPIHGAIYLGEELILHQRLDTKSSIEGLRKAHLKYISYVARYKT